VSCFCSACSPVPSRRQFLCSVAATAATAATVIGASGKTGSAQQPSGATTAGRPMLIKGGCVLTLDRAIGDFEQADVLIQGGKISAVQASISAAESRRCRRAPVRVRARASPPGHAIV